jgi:uncharacterized protein with von Willebrand factor type A (vWA) domain
LDIKLETDESTVVLNAVIDGVSDALSGGLTPSSKTIQKRLLKTGFNGGNLAKTSKADLRKEGVAIDRIANKALKDSSKQLVEGTGDASKTVESTYKVVKNATKDEVKQKTN